jgi:glycosyltransferase involved in cell wall biosynthesis
VSEPAGRPDVFIYVHDLRSSGVVVNPLAFAERISDEHSASLVAPAPHPWLADNMPVVLGIGRLRPQKNFDLLIRGVSAARRTRRVRLVIVGGGSGSERQGLGRLAEDGGLGGDFLLAGETDNAFGWIAGASVFVLPSRWETSSLALLEVMAVGAPVIASSTAGDAGHVLAQGRFGLLVDGSCAEELGRAIVTQLSDGRVLPGSRAADFPTSHTTDARADVLSALLEA